MLLLVALGAIGVLLLVFGGRSATPAEVAPMTVAFVGRQSPHSENDTLQQAIRKDHDQFHYAALERHLERLKSDGLPVNFKLKYYANLEKPEDSEAIYREIVADDSIVLVFDNSWGREFQVVAEAIIEGGLPVISLNADKGGKDFNQQVVFLGADDHTPGELASFFEAALEAEQAIFITEAEEEYDLTQEFVTEFGDRFVHTLPPLDEDRPKPEELDAVIDNLRSYFAENEAASTLPIVLNTHAGWGSPLLNRLDLEFENLTLLGGHYNVNEGFRQGEFGRESGNSFYSILEMTSDTITEQIHEDLRLLRPRFEKFQDRRAAPLFLDRVYGAVAIVEQAVSDDRKAWEEKQEQLIPEERREYPGPGRQAFLSHFKALSERAAELRREGAGQGVCFQAEHDIMEFDEELVSMAESVFIRYGPGEAVATLKQVDSQKREIIPSLRMGFKVTNVFDIDARAGDFGADLYYWTEWSKDQEELEQRLIFKNLKEGSFLDQPVRIDLGDSWYQLHRLSGRFTTAFDVADYPLDSHHLRIEVEVLEPSQRIRLSFDQDSLRETGIGGGVSRIQEWDIEDFYVTVDNNVSKSLYGRSAADACGQKNKHLAAHIMISRNPVGPLLTIVVPLILIGLVSLSVLYVDNLTFESVGHAAVGIFLGVVAFLIALSDIAPDLSQVSKAGLLFWATFVIVILVIMALVVINSRWGSEASRRRVVRLSRIGLPVVYLVSLVLIRIF